MYLFPDRKDAFNHMVNECMFISLLENKISYTVNVYLNDSASSTVKFYYKVKIQQESIDATQAA